MGDNQEDIAVKAASLDINDNDVKDNDDVPRMIIDEDFELGGDETETAAGENPQEEPKTEKKKKKKSKSKKKKKITGFEEQFQEGPITPDIFEEEQKLYDPGLAITERLQTAIQRYQAKRNMDNDRLHVFKSWMQYGGVDTKAKVFGGLDQKDLKELDAQDILQARATSSIPENRKGWKVDFEEVAKGFLSSSLAELFCVDTEETIHKATGVLRNFLNYLLYHNVCPEYADNILAARNVVDTAQKELRLVHEADLWSPGDFNMACSTLFGGQYMDGYTGDAAWHQELPDRIEIEGVRGLPDNVARKIVMFGIAGGASEEQALLFRDKATANTVEAARLEDVSGFEVVEVVQPDEGTREFYRDSASDLQIIGKLRAKIWKDPGEPPEDFPPEYYETPHKEDFSASPKGYDFEFLVDEGLLRFCFVGMKFTADIYELEECGGIYYFDNVLGIYCSFYTILNNGLLDGWKEPRPYTKKTSGDDDDDEDDNEDDDDDYDARREEQRDTNADEKSAISNAQNATQKALDAAVSNTER
ncbi:NADPH:quinone reductase [Ascosphaera pollenicola]|nr:NADPH:quinone reductase [Ascosphaera pollenicola]